MADPPKLWEIGRADSGEIWVRYYLVTPVKEMKDSLAAMTEYLPEKNARLVIDLRGLNGHNPDGRGLIQGWLKSNRRRIALLVVLLPKAVPIVKLITAAVGVAVGIKMRVLEACDLPEPQEFSTPRAGA